MEVAFVCDWLIDPDIGGQEEEGGGGGGGGGGGEGENRMKMLGLLGSGVAKPKPTRSWISEFRLIKIVALFTLLHELYKWLYMYMTLKMCNLGDSMRQYDTKWHSHHIHYRVV